MLIRQPARGEAPERHTFAGTGTNKVLAATLWALAALVPACADEPPPPTATPATAAASAPAPVAAKPLPPLPRSSIAAVVQHRGELGLTNEQIDALEKRDREREDEDRALRAEDEKRKKAVEDAARNAQNQPQSNRSPSGGLRGGGLMGGGMRGGGMMRGPGGGNTGGGGKAQGESLEDRLDANDTKAFFDIEDVLTPEQRDPAREIASDYRAQLYDRRAQQRAAAK